MNDALDVNPSVPFAADEVNAADPPRARRKRHRQANPIPLDQRVLIELTDGACLMSVSYRTAKRIAADHPELTAQVNRRRLFVRAKLLAWIEAGCPAPKPTRR
jgi:hypothetical protein